ncbi:DNA mismatch repair protein PMS2 [Nematocida minor]|uniref:DNA mismatch repair protein PMS2 n=1 Tax=Nematocida minor TaxID=1912983 RepID=UPI0022201621|nr:DNA mismatch repair protein PMS2 [Nematocida minor]KAI5193028.1 DNA mismatch repair protein PMS2 [Nematocida minor]
MIKILSSEDANSIRTEQILPNAYTLVNELVKNSIDSGSSAITIRIDIVNSSIIYIVEDNGAGIEVNRFFLMKGGTSKGVPEGAFTDRASYGFKGVTLNSLIAVADFIITTNNNGKTVRIEVKEKNITVNSTDYHKENRGTTIRVDNYYKNKPIRHNYLFSHIGKSINSIVDAIRKYTAIHNVQFKLYKNSKLIYNTPYNIAPLALEDSLVNYTDRICTIYNILNRRTVTFQSSAMSLVYIISEGKGIEGIIHNKMTVIENPKIDKLIKSSAKIDSKVYYNLAINSTSYKEIAIIKEIENISTYSIKSILDSSPQTKEHTINVSQSSTNSTIPSNTNRSAANSNGASKDSTAIANNSNVNYSQNKNEIVTSTKSVNTPKKENIGIDAMVIDSNEVLMKYRHKDGIGLNTKEIGELSVVGQFNNGFIICTAVKSSGLHIYAVDQHAADEAVNYERLKKAYEYKRQKLIKPVPMNINSYDTHIIEENIKEIERHGFILNSACTEIHEAPVYQGRVFGEKEIVEIVERIKEGRVQEGKDRVVFEELRKILASKACRTSIMIGQPLNMQKMKDILNNLSLTTRPWNCPHGRPTILLLQSPKEQF